ncbi:MAG: hypothetical protein DLM53_09485 [Candidatus Eremiobacter antarcticus]|nr:hypothetical protein [Candidatus Eremiobacteraeota bacterium]MBC5807496.1 hypothetical protein [Candidatus Eremiobacteraeota bacterium]PZR61448.1 MAG: hypothetical protein DLM53_09485 [Candidatus Eremiobacter sp. RRmetagenome_bin22]
MTDLNALLYLDARILINRVRQTMHQPGRLIMWILFTLWLVAVMSSRFHRLSGANRYGDPQHPLLVIFSIVPALYAMVLGAQIATACKRAPGAFAYPADARFLFGSRMSHRIVVFWLQLRELFFSGIRFMIFMFAMSFTFVRSNAELLVAAVSLLAGYLIAMGVRLPAFLLARRYPRVPWSFLGYALIALGGASIAYPLWLAYLSGHTTVAFVSAHVPRYPPGSWLVGAFNGSLRALFLMCSLAALMIVVGSVAASDAYPELWEASVRLYALRVAAAAGRARRSLLSRAAGVGYADPQAAAKRQAQRSDIVSASGFGAPSGALILLWKQWLTIRRVPGGLRWPVLWIVIAAAAGYGGAVIAKGSSPLMLLAPAMLVSNLIVGMGAQSTISLAGELRKPIWWLAESEVRDRLAAWALASLLRLGAPIAVVGIALGVGMHAPLLAFGAVPLVVAVLLLIQATGIALYTILPGRNDLRGPGFILRYFATIFLLSPPAVMWAIAQFASHSLLAGGVTGLLFAGLESWLLVAFAAARLEGNGMAYAAAEDR